MTRLLINAAPCAIGGSVQVSLGVIREAMAQAVVRGWTLTLAVSPAVGRALEAEVAKAGVRMFVFPAGPGSVRAGRVTRAGLRRLCEAAGADMVFTVFGPSYVRFPVPEYMGFAEPFAITPVKGCYANHTPVGALSAWLKGNAKRLFLRSAQRFWVETETAKAGLCRRAFIAPTRVDVVPNGVNAAFAAALAGSSPATSGDLLLVGAGYPHKNHVIILPAVRELQRRLPDAPWRFVLTLPEDAPGWIALRDTMAAAGLAHRVFNAGVLNLAQCAAAYEAATVIFHPSLLEIFSAGYVEAMAARRPLVVSDRPFSREICAEAAAYFDPLDGESAGAVLAGLLTSSPSREALVAKGDERLKKFPDASAKNGRLCDLIESFARDHVR